MASEGRPATCDDVLSLPGFVRAATARASGVRGCFAVPVVVCGRVEIVLEFFAHRIRALDDDVLQLLTFVAGHLAAVVIDQAPGTHALDAALAHMSHGCSMTDAEDRVVMVNPKYLELYGLSAEAVRPGTPMRTVIERSVSVGNHPNRDTDNLWKVRQNLMVDGIAAYRDVLPGDRIVDVRLNPLGGGGKGWVTIFDDVT